MNVRLTLIFTLLMPALAINIFECKKSEVIEPEAGYEQPTDIRKIVPMRVGLSWTYTGIRFNDASPDYKIDISLKVADSQYSNGSFFYGLDAVTTVVSTDTSLDQTNDTTVSSWLVWLDSNSYRRSDDSWPYVILKTPVRRNLRWQYYPVDSTAGFLLISHPDTTVLVDSTKYDHAIVVERDASDGSFISDYYVLVPGIGIVSEGHGQLFGATRLTLASRNF